MMKFSWQYNLIAKKRLRNFLFAKGISRNLLKQIKFHGGKIIVNHNQQFPSYFLKYGDLVTIILPKESPNPKVIPSKLPINIVYEDANFLIVDKPPYLHSMPASNDDNDALINRVKWYLITHHLSGKTHIVTRLDGDTSGLVVFAKHHYAHSVLDAELKNKQLRKWYIAVVSCSFINHHYEINLPIGRDSNSYIKRKITLDGKASKTEFWVLKQNLNMAMILVRLHTGRTHQIRIHLKAIGHPLVGDWLYNPTSQILNRQALHCFKVQFYSPFDHKIINCKSALPFDIKNLIANL